MYIVYVLLRCGDNTHIHEQLIIKVFLIVF
jgi:hypothetical protein